MTYLISMASIITDKRSSISWTAHVQFSCSVNYNYYQSLSMADQPHEWGPTKEADPEVKDIALKVDCS